MPFRTNDPFSPIPIDLPPQTEAGPASRLRIFVWALICGLIFGAIDLGRPVEEALRNYRNASRLHDASGDIVIVAIDDRSMKELEQWPWPRRYHAQMLDHLERLNADTIFFDIDFSSKSNAVDDRLLREALARLGEKAVMPIWTVTNTASGDTIELRPISEFSDLVSLATINVDYDRNGIVWRLPYAKEFIERPYPSFAGALARADGAGAFRIDYAIDPRSIPIISAADLVAGRVSASKVAGKSIIIGTASEQAGDIHFAPGYGKIPGAYLHVLGAETLKVGTPVDLGWLIPLLAAMAVGGLCLLPKSRPQSLSLLVIVTVAILVVPLPLDQALIFTDVLPAFVALLMTAGRLAWSAFRSSYRARGAINVVSGLPNLNALREETVAAHRPLIAARFQHFAKIASALPAEEEKAVVAQIANRLTIGSSDPKLYQGDEGIFVWFAHAGMEGAIGGHLEALHALFRSPVMVADTPVDLSVTFGVDCGSDRSVANRLGSALVAADEAASDGRKWKEYDPTALKDAGWKLSLLSQMDAAIDSGDIWVAYQPKLDLATRRISGAEALVRWNHPEKGAISPMEFIPTAEQNDRIEKLTFHVLERAIGAASTFNRHGLSFDIAVNLSARLIDNEGLVPTVTRLLDLHALPADRLTLEITETAALSSDAGLETLHRLRALGVQISIDDYGTGLSTLDYLKKIPATEIKIDRSFVHAMGKSHSDRIMVNSTIHLAHSLGHKVVAEGVEDEDILEALAIMGCDSAQGFLIARPMPLRSLMRQLLAEQGRQAA